MKPQNRASTRTCHHKPDFQRYDFVAYSPSQFLQWICAPRCEIITLELQKFEVFMLLYFQPYDFVSGCANPLQKLGRGASNEIVRLKTWLMMTCPGHWYAVCLGSRITRSSMPCVMGAESESNGHVKESFPTSPALDGGNKSHWLTKGWSES